jgi:hypothetical protein
MKSTSYSFLSVCPKLPMRNKAITRSFFLEKLGFKDIGAQDFEAYLMIEKDSAEIHFFEFLGLNPRENYGQVYLRVNNIDALFEYFKQRKIEIHPAGHLETKPWGQKEFSILDPDNNLITFGETQN